MAKGDFVPFKSPLGGTYEVRVAGVTASQTFEMGEPVGIVAAGTVTEATAANWVVSDMAIGIQGGIACYGPGASNINPKTGVAFATNDEVAFWPINQGILFRTSGPANFKATGASGAGAETAPLVTDIGTSYEISSNGTNWCIEKTAGTTGVDVEAKIVDVLDINLAPIRISGNAGVYAVFELTATLAAA